MKKEFEINDLLKAIEVQFTELHMSITAFEAKHGLDLTEIKKEMEDRERTIKNYIKIDWGKT